MSEAGDDSGSAAAADAAARRSYGKLVAILSARSGDLAAAEDALAEAFVHALLEWPQRGVPRQPEAWLLTVARRRWIDAIRTRQRDAAASGVLALVDEFARAEADWVLPDRRLELIFACAHPGIDAAARAPLILQTVLGFDAATIASAFLVSPQAMSQRLVRAKAKIRDAGIAFRVPELAEMPARLDPVLDAIYAAYAEAWTDPQGADPRRRNLADEALWLARLLAQSLPQQAEALGLAALMLFSHARRRARRDEHDDYVPLEQQDVSLWDGAMIDEAEALLRRAGALRTLGRYQLEAAVQSAHCVRRFGRAVPWQDIVGLYDALVDLSASPVCRLNRIVAAARVSDLGEALAELHALAADQRLADYQPYWAARADLHARAGDAPAAIAAYERAVGLERDPAVRRFLQHRLEALGASWDNSSSPVNGRVS